jgi:hypothetical protein
MLTILETTDYRLVTSKCGVIVSLEKKSTHQHITTTGRDAASMMDGLAALSHAPMASVLAGLWHDFAGSGDERHAGCLPVL